MIVFNIPDIYNGLILHSNVRTRTERPFDRYMRFPSRFLEIAAFPAEKIQRKHAKPLEKFVDSNYDHQISRQLERHKWRSVYIYIYISITSKNQGERRIAQVSLIIERRPIVGSQDETDYWSSTRLCAVTQVYLSTGAEIATYSWQRGRACRRYMHTYGATTRTYLAKWAHVRFDMAPSRTLSLSALVILKGVVSRRDP